MTGDTIEEVIAKLEEDAELVLRFMASNGLVANASKTSLMILNHYNKYTTTLTTSPTITHAPTHAPTHARSSLSIEQNPNPTTPPNPGLT